MNTNPHICKSCGNEFTGQYCNICGEKIITAEDRSFKAIWSDIMTAITLADNKLFKSLKLVIINPGYLSREFAEGRTVKYLKPMSVFFVLNLVYFLFPLIQLFNASLITQLNTTYGKISQVLVATKTVEKDIPLKAFEVMYNQKTTGLAKLLVIVFVVIASLPLNLFYRKRNRFFSDHMGLMVELACFNLFVNALIMTLLLTVFSKFQNLGQHVDDDVLAVIFITTNLYFLIRSSFTFYGQRGIKLILKSVVMIGILKVALEAYRFILFLVTMWAV